MMYVLELELPFNVTLVYRQMFVSEQAASTFAKGYPQYLFKTIPVSEIDSGSILVPLTPLKIEEK